MVNNPVSVTTSAMKQVATKFQDEAAQSKSDLQAVQTQRSQLGISWTGEASQIFGRALDRWCGEYQVIISQLDTMANALHGAGQIFARTEADNISSVSNLMPAGGGNPIDNIVSPPRGN